MTFSTKQRLGRGLAALIGENTQGEHVKKEDILLVPVERVSPNPFNPRKHFDEESLQELALSIGERGVLLPLLVRPSLGDTYQIVAGERRWRASQMAGLCDVPVIVRHFSDLEVLEVALVENIQRFDLNPLEEAKGYQELMEKFGYTQQKLASSVGKSRSHVANMLRLLALPEKVQEHIEKGRLTVGHARALIATSDPEGLAERAVAFNLSVRETEQMVREKNNPASVTEFPRAEKREDIRALEQKLFDALGEPIEIVDRGARGGYMTIRYRNREQLQALVVRLLREEGAF